MIVDFHTHIQDLKISEDELKNIFKSITPFVSGYSIAGNRKAIEIAEKFNLPYYLGLAPQEAQSMSFEEIDREISFIASTKKYGIGEIGMDFHWGDSEEKIKKQLYAFEKQLELAEKEKLPIVVHSRKAEDYIIDLLMSRSFKQKVAFHFYSGKLKTAKKAFDNLNSYFSIVPFPSKDRKKVILSLPLENILVETDSPYAGKTPLDVVKSIEYVSRLKSMDFDEVARQTSLNAFQFINYP